MKQILEYMTLSRVLRREHLVLDSACIEIGGGSIEFKGLLAYHLGTTIPTKLGHRVQLCHACGNGNCSNVNHLYWGSARDNVQDMIEHGTYKSINQRTKEKYGDDAEQKLLETARKASKIARKKKPVEHWEKFRPFFNGVDFSQAGWAYDLQEKIGYSATHIRRIAKKLELI